MGFKEFSTLAEVRSGIYSFLSTIYLQPVSLSFTEKILDENLYPALSSITSNKLLPADIIDGLKILKKFVEESKSKPIEALREDLAVERTRLLRGIGPDYGPPPPYEAVYREWRVMGKSTIKALKKYFKAGVSLSNECKEIPDHIGIELGFMQFLCDKESEAWRSKKRDDAMKYLTMEKEFVHEHIARWIPVFCDRVITETRVDFYLGIAKFTKGFITFDRELIENLYQMAKVSSNNRAKNPGGL